MYPRKSWTAYRHCFNNQGLRLLLSLMELPDVLKGHIEGRSNLRIKLLLMKLLDPGRTASRFTPSDLAVYLEEAIKDENTRMLLLPATNQCSGSC
jgi:hypothetical protein